MTNLQGNVFVFDVAIDGRVWNDRNADGLAQRGEPGVGGALVSLLDSDGNVLQAARTTPDGRYHFAGLDLGSYGVRVDAADGWKATTRQQSSVVATRGQRFDNVSFGQQRIAAPAQPQQPPPPPPANQPPPPAAPSHARSVTQDVLDAGRKSVRAVLN